jgi:DNA-directed RNA polymerase specialized sigma24 family protein
MSSEPGTPPSAAPDDTATRFDRAGESAYNLALRITGSPGAAWHATAAAFAAVAERIPADADPGIAEQDLLLMGCWHARSLLAQVASSPEYAAQLRAHDEAALAAAPPQTAVVAANAALPVDQREVLALRGLSDLDHAELSALLRVDPGLLATMLAQSRLMLRDALTGTDLAATATEDPEDRHALALAALRQDSQLRGAEGRERLSAWLGSSDSHGALVAALDEAGLSYRGWAPEPAPAGLRDAAVAAASAVVPAPLIGATPPAPDAPDDGTPVAGTASTEAAPATAPTTPDPVAGRATPTPEPAAPSGPVAPRGAGAQPPADPGATVEWSSTDIAALGLEGAAPARPVVPVRAASAAADVDDDSEDEWDDAWDSGEQSGDLLQPVDQAGRAPRWQIAVVAILLVAVIVALVVALSSGGDGPPAEEDAPTPAGTTTGRTTDTTGAVRSGRLVGEIHLENATIRILRG